MTEALLVADRSVVDLCTATLVASQPAAGPAPQPVAGPAPEPVAGHRPEPPARRLEIPRYSLTSALRLERELGLGHALAQILVRRGLGDPEAARRFLAAEAAHDPLEFAGIELALATIRRHISVGSRISVHGDYDVDGICATAIMIRALRALGANAGWLLPSRIDDGYGLAASTVQRLADRGTALILTVDCGITAVSEVAQARAAGVDVVITDHHAPRTDGELPDCPIVHPGLCRYPCPQLCGAGVAYKLALALGAGTAADDLELVALATVADLVPLLGENRRLVREGLRALANTAKPGLRALMSVTRADPSALDTSTVGFRLAPRINAAGRLRRADCGVELMLTDDPERAREIAGELDALNVERRAVEQRILWQAETQVAQLGRRTAYVLASEEWHPGVIGIVASRIVEHHHRPAILVALDGEIGTGSGRSIPGFDLLAALQAGADHLERYGGHRAAAGLSMRRERLEAFRLAVETHAAAALTPEMLEPVERVDAIVSGAELGLSLAEELEALQPCGMGNPSPRLLIPGARFSDVRPMGEGRHARFSVSSGGVRARAVAFGCEGQVGDGRPVDATFKLERNTWNASVEPRLVLRHWQPCRPPAIVVIGEPGDYLGMVLRELEGSVEPESPGDPCPQALRTLLDRRGESPLAVLSDALAGEGAVLAVCADVPRRLEGLRTRVGGFSMACYQALERDPSLTAGFRHLVALDPPAGPRERARLQAAAGFTYLAWGEPELRFAEQMHELEYGLRASLVALYRTLRGLGRAAGEELERLLRGDGPHGRSPRLAGRLVRVLAELELVSLDRDLPALTIASRAPTTLEDSPSYRVYAQRYEDGRRFLSRANQPLSV